MVNYCEYKENSIDLVTLYSCDYVTGRLPNIDTKAIAQMVMKNHLAKRTMHEDPNNIRGEDIRIDYDDNIQELARALCDQYALASNNTRKIKLSYEANSDIHKDSNESYWAIVHGKGETTELHSHENYKNYSVGPHVSSAFWIQVPENSGDFVFQYNPNPYMEGKKTIKSKEGCFLMFDSTLKHYVTENLSDDLRIVVSMNFNMV